MHEGHVLVGTFNTCSIIHDCLSITLVIHKQVLMECVEPCASPEDPVVLQGVCLADGVAMIVCNQVHKVSIGSLMIDWTRWRAQVLVDPPVECLIVQVGLRGQPGGREHVHDTVNRINHAPAIDRAKLFCFREYAGKFRYLRDGLGYLLTTSASSCNVSTRTVGLGCLHQAQCWPNWSVWTALHLCDPCDG